MKIKKILIITISTCLAIAFTGCSKREKNGENNSVASSDAPKSAVPNSFDKVTANLDKSGDMFIYLSTEQIISTADQYLNDITQSIETTESINDIIKAGKTALNQSGIMDISGIGMSRVEIEPNLFRQKIAVHHEESKSDGKIWSILGSKEPRQLELFKLLPEDTVLAISNEFNAKVLFDWFPELASATDNPEIEEQVKVAMSIASLMLQTPASLESLGNQFSLFITLDKKEKTYLPPELGGEIPNPGLAIAIKILNDKVPDMIFQALEAQGAPMEEQTLNGTKSLVFTEASPFPFPVSPTIFKLDNHFILASSEELAKNIISTHQGNAPRLTSTEEYKQLSKGLNTEANHMLYLGKRFAQSLAPAIKSVIESAGDLPPEIPIDINSIPFDITKLNPEEMIKLRLLAFIKNNKNGMIIESQSSNVN